MAAISFIGVSIFSSALTTILAMLPLLGTKIQLFTRFGEILLLDTAVAILYTLLICSNCLALFGPPLGEGKLKRVLNAVFTIVCGFGIYLLAILGMYFASHFFGISIPSPDGGRLFSS